MRCLSLHQPWASLITVGAKPDETRSWPCPPMIVGQRIAIQAAKTDMGIAHVLGNEVLRAICSRRFTSLGALPFGAIVCTAIVTSCERTETARARLTCDQGATGDYSAGRWAWHLADVRGLDLPIPMRGMQGLFTLPDRYVDELMARGAA